MTDFIYDDQTGACLARIVNGKVFSENPGKPQIGVVRDGGIYGLDGEFVGHLARDGEGGASANETFKKLLLSP